jgi:PAS domain S-box-containing protein
MSPGERPVTEVVTDPSATALMLEQAPAAFALVDADRRIVDAGGALLGALGLEREDCVGRVLDEVVADPRITALADRGLAGEAFAVTTDVLGKRVMVALRPTNHDGNAAVAAVASYAESGDLREVLSAREADLARFAALVEQSDDFIAMADLEGRITFLNGAGAALVGLARPADALGLSPVDFFVPEERLRAEDALAVLRERGHWQGESELRNFATGAPVPCGSTRSSSGGPRTAAPWRWRPWSATCGGTRRASGSSPPGSPSSATSPSSAGWPSPARCRRSCASAYGASSSGSPASWPASWCVRRGCGSGPWRAPTPPGSTGSGRSTPAP